MNPPSIETVFAVIALIGSLAIFLGPLLFWVWLAFIAMASLGDSE